MLEKFRAGLSAKLLLLTILFVMMAEVFIFVPSVSNFRVNWLKERAATAQVASLALEAAPDGQVPKKLQYELLQGARVVAVALRRNNKHVLILKEDMPHRIEEHFDLRHESFFKLVLDALKVFFRTEDRVVRVVALPYFGAGESIEIFLHEKPLREAMIQFGFNILGLSIAISVFTAALVYLTLNALFVRPVAKLTRSMMQFRDDPENPAKVIRPSDRGDEIGMAERELASMQRELVQSLKQKNRLALLGLAVSKISHDLRNMLANAQLISDRFEAIDNPTVQRFAPKLIGALDRAIRLCTETLKYGSAQEALPVRSQFLLRPLIDEVGQGIGLPDDGPVDWDVDVDDELIADADRDQLYRVLSNLCRNAQQVLLAQEDGKGRERKICVKAERDADDLTITVSDTGPGLPQKARANLFEAFKGAAREGGTGLGLVISAELIRAHGGDIAYVDSEGGAVFRITIPYGSETSLASK